jgi:hypothetical protein
MLHISENLRKRRKLSSIDRVRRDRRIFYSRTRLLCVLRASALKTVADPSFGGSAVQSPSPASQESLKTQFLPCRFRLRLMIVVCADSVPEIQIQVRPRYFPFRPGRDRQIVHSHYLPSFFSSANHFANTRRDALFEVPPSGGPLKTVILTVRSP